MGICRLPGYYQDSQCQTSEHSMITRESRTWWHRDVTMQVDMMSRLLQRQGNNIENLLQNFEWEFKETFLSSYIHLSISVTLQEGLPHTEIEETSDYELIQNGDSFDKIPLRHFVE